MWNSPISTTCRISTNPALVVVIKPAKETLMIDSANEKIAKAPGIETGVLVVVIERLLASGPQAASSRRCSARRKDTFRYQVDIC